LTEDRLVFAGDEHLRRSELVARYLLADAALDSFPYGSHVTASEALWAGCPLVTRTGSTFASRVAGSLLMASGLGELVAQSRQDYRRIAIELGNDRQRASQLRAFLQQTRNTNPAFDTPRFVRELESAYQLAFNRHLRGLPPGSIDVPPQGSAPDERTGAARRL
jgi:predicted O-linked N-acetylglucosamine transferase (SPINDLY family)